MPSFFGTEQTVGGDGCLRLGQELGEQVLVMPGQAFNGGAVEQIAGIGEEAADAASAVLPGIQAQVELGGAVVAVQGFDLPVLVLRQQADVGLLVIDQDLEQGVLP